MTEIIADDLFAGAGGWDVAARWLGIRARGVENMAAARATRDAAGLETIHDDVWTFRPDGRARLKISSPPCQTFSQSGSGSGRRALNDVLGLIPFVADLTLDQLRESGQHLGDDRTALVLTPLWFALHTDTYREIAWEQVPTVQPVWDACAAELSAHGWHVVTGKVQSEQFGVAQTRERSVLLGSRDRAVSLPTPTHSRYHKRSPERLDPGVAPWRNMAQVLGMGLEDRVVSNYGTGGDPRNRGIRNGAQPAFTVTSKVGKNKVQLASGTRPRAAVRHEDQPAPTLAFGHDSASYVFTPAGMTPEEIVHWKARVNNQSGTDYDIEDQMAKPAAVIAGRGMVGFRGANANRFNGSTKSRNDGIRLTVAEAGVLQSFPADHPWRGNEGQKYLQVGNAVPPLMAMALLVALYPELAII